MRRRRALVTLASLATIAVAAPTTAPAFAQQLGEGMDRTGTLDIRSDEERAVFGDLQCTCGCPREAISTCTCSFAAGFRSEVREMMARGMTREEIKAEWVRRHGLEALTVAPNAGAWRLVYLAPIGAIVGMGAVAITVLRRFRKKADEHDKARRQASGVEAPKRDEYDDKLDEELRQLDDE